jgi:hypothetical protein
MPVIIVIYQAIDGQLSACMHFRPIAVRSSLDLARAHCGMLRNARRAGFFRSPQRSFCGVHTSQPDIVDLVATQSGPTVEWLCRSLWPAVLPRQSRLPFRPRSLFLGDNGGFPGLSMPLHLVRFVLRELASGFLQGSIDGVQYLSRRQLGHGVVPSIRAHQRRTEHGATCAVLCLGPPFF